MFMKEVPDVGKITTIDNGKAHFNADTTYHHVSSLEKAFQPL